MACIWCFCAKCLKSFCMLCDIDCLCIHNTPDKCFSQTIEENQIDDKLIVEVTLHPKI